jgi:PhoPQ-activated pathogenicity-related protein
MRSIRECKKDFDDYHIDEFLVPGTSKGGFSAYLRGIEEDTFLNTTEIGTKAALTGTRDEKFINVIVIKILLGSAVVQEGF